MSVRLSSPKGMMPSTPYHHVAVAAGTRHVYIAGQVATNQDGAPHKPGDLAGQVASALRNVHEGLASTGATFTDVVRLTFYVTGWAPEKIDAFMAGIESVAEELALPLPMPPASLIGVESLFEPDVLVEVEATAILD